MLLGLLGGAANPFKVTPDPALAHRDAGFVALTDRLAEAEGAEPIQLVLGDPGTGKTILLRTLEARLAAAGRPPGFRACEHDEDAAALFDGIDGPQPILLLDEAEKLSAGALGRLAEQARSRGATVIAAALPRLAEEAESLPSGTVAVHRLAALDAAEAHCYVTERLARADLPPTLFSGEAIAAIAAAGKGIPGRINLLCSAALFEASSRDADHVSTEIARAVIAERTLVPSEPLPPPTAAEPAPVEPEAEPVESEAEPPAPLPVLRAEPFAPWPESRPSRGRWIARAAAAALAAAAAVAILLPWAGSPIGTVGIEPAADTTAPAAVVETAVLERAVAEAGEAASTSQPPAEIDRLLAEAEAQMTALALTTPPGANAADSYRAVLALEPQNQTAQDGLRAVARRYRSLAETATARGDRAKAESYRDKAEALAPAAAPARLQEPKAAEPKAAETAVLVPPPSAEAGEALTMAMLGDPASLSRALAAGRSPSLTLPGGEAPLLAAARQGGPAVRLLLQAGANPDQHYAGQDTPLMVAAARGDAEALRALLVAGARPDAADGAGQTALMRAAAAGHEAAVRVLLEGGASPTIAAGNGWTAVMYAIWNRHPAIAARLSGRRDTAFDLPAPADPGFTRTSGR